MRLIRYRPAGPLDTWACLTATLFLLTSGAMAEPVDTAAPVRQSAPVIVANRSIIVLRGPIGGYSARERVANVARRINAVLAGDQSPTVTTQDTEEGTKVLLGGQFAFIVTGIDVDREGEETTRIAAREAVKRLEQAIAEYREQHSPRYLLIKTGWVALATFILAGFLRLVFVTNRWAGRRLALAIAARAKKVRFHGVRLFDPRQIRWIARRLFALLAWAVSIFAAYTWLVFSLKQFPYTRAWGEHMEGQFLGIAANVALNIVDAIPGLTIVVVVILLAWLTIRTANLFFDRIERGAFAMGTLDADTIVPTRRIFQIVVWVFALVLAYPYLPGADTEAFKGVSVLVGLMVSIGGASLVGQAASGLILMYTRAFRVGEYVRIGDTVGTIVGLGTFATRISTGLGEEVMLPNSYALQNTTRNFSRTVEGAGFVVNTPVSIGYSTPWRQVHAMLEDAARRTPDIASEPAPFVRQTALSDFYVEYRLVAYAAIANPVERVDLMSQLHANIQDVFNEHGVQIMSPHYMTDPAHAKIVPKARWYASPAKPPAD